MNRISIACMVLGLAGLLAAWFMFNQHRHAQAEMVQLEAEVVTVERRDVRVNRDQMTRFYHPIVRFNNIDESENMPTMMILESGSQLKHEYFKGKPLVLLFPKGKPERARIRTWNDAPVLPIAIAVFSALLIGLGLQRQSRCTRAET